MTIPKDRPAASTGPDGPTQATAAPGDIPVVAPPAARAVIRRLLVVGATATCAILAVIAAGRLTHLDDAVGWPYSGINAFTPLAYLPAYAAAAVAFAYRRNLLLLFAAAIVVTHLVWTVPDVIPRGAEHAPAGSTGIRVMTANLNYGNARAGQLGEQIRAEDPGLVVIQEASALSLRGLLSSGALDGYPHRELHPAEGAFGSAVFSRFPLRDVGVPLVAGLPSLQVTVDLAPTRSFRLFAVHTISPTASDYTRRWRVQMEALRAEARDTTLPVVMAGDFNATSDHRPFRRLLDAGMRDSHDVAGSGWAPTWNADSLLPRLLRIDHVLASPAFAVTGHRVGDPFGSDHVPVTADLALR